MDYAARLEGLRREHEELKRYYFSRKGKMEQLEERRRVLEESIGSTEEGIDVLEKVKLLLQNVSEYAREQSRARIETLVTNCLQFIFDSGIRFSIEINEVRGRPEAEFYVISTINGEEIKTKPQDARGGGVVDIISLAIRIAMIQSSSLEIDGPIILDEPAKHVSDDYITQVAEFLKQVSRMFGRQIIMVTHNRHLSEIADTWHRIELVDGTSVLVNDS